MAAPRPPKWVLVVGECGDGKSTLINNLLMEGATERPEMGLKSRGVTKDIRVYPGRPLEDGTPLLMLDTPGVGDMDVTPMALVTMIEAALSAHQTDHLGGIDGVIVTQKVTDGRMRLGAQVVRTLVNRGFVGGGEKWSNIILVGTFGDRAEPEHVACFQDQVVPLFFEQAPGQRGPHVVVSRADVEPLRRVRYEAPEASVLAGDLAERLGVERGAFQGELTELRQQMAAMVEQNEQLMLRITQQAVEHQEQMSRMTREMSGLQGQLARAQEQMAEAQRQAAADLRRCRGGGRCATAAGRGHGGHGRALCGGRGGGQGRGREAG